ncbi:MAG: DUF1232 domain-containing protein [Acidobacteriota bacterium]|nr:DUF1232 domain-containing protein [Acidobacteriota bacterium]
MDKGFGGRIARGVLFARLKENASAYLRDPDKLRDLVQKAKGKAEAAGASGPLKDMWQSLLSLLRLLRAYASGQYRNVPAKSLVLIVAGILYFVMPIDLIPDFVVGIGFLDDAAVLAWVMSSVRTVVTDFEKWEASRPPQ